MSKQKILLYSTLLIIGYNFLPVFFSNIPLPGLWFGMLLMYSLSLFLVAPKIFISKQLIIVYTFSVVYFIMAPFTESIVEKAWFVRRFLPLFVSVSLYTYYLRYPVLNKTLRIVLWYTIIIIIISCITTIIGLSIYPMASRDLASGVWGDEELADFYRKMGIVGFGFINALAYIIPLFVLFYKTSKKYKVFYLILILVSFYTVIKAQYTTQLLLFVMALLISWFGASFILRNKVFIVLTVFILAILPNSFYSVILEYVAQIIPGETLKIRIIDLAETIQQGDISEGDTHTADRFSRIPFLLSEFIKSPIIGGGKSDGHIFWLNHLSLYGVIGIIPWIMILVDNYKIVKKRLTNTYIYYQIAFLMFIALGFMKNSGNREQYIVLFLILPIGLLLFERNELFRPKKHVIK